MSDKRTGFWRFWGFATPVAGLGAAKSPYRAVKTP
jgi:hypothetical protein